MAQDTLDRVQEIARTVFGSNDIVLTPETTAADVDGWDSISHMQLIMSVEKSFGMRFSASDLAGLANVGDLLEVVSTKAKH